MPIITTQRRMAEHGRIRLGQQVATSGGRTRPDKLDRFRFTSANQGLIEQIATRYGGEARPWDNKGKAEFEVISDARSIPVIVVKGGFSQWHELWTAGGLQHRCDGEKDPAGAYCNPDDPNHQAALQKPTTRLSVMLSEVESLGVWRMESHGWNAAAELPSMAELAMVVGDLVPATLSLAERSSIIETPKGPQTSRFVVPVLDLHVTKARLVELVGGPGGAPAIGGGVSDARQITAGPDEVPDDLVDAIADCATADDVRALWRRLGESGRLTPAVQQRLTEHASELAAETAEEPQANDDGTYDAQEVPDDADGAQAAWMEVVSVAGQHGWTTSMLTAAFEQWAAIPVGDGDAEQFRGFLAALRRGDIDAPSEGAA